MEQFYNNWNEIMNDQRPNLTDLELATTLWRKLQGSQQLKKRWWIYGMAFPGATPRRRTPTCMTICTGTWNGTALTGFRRLAHERPHRGGVFRLHRSMTRSADSGNKATVTTATDVSFNILQSSGAPNRAGVIRVLLRRQAVRKEDAPEAGVEARDLALCQKTYCNPAVRGLFASSGLVPVHVSGRTALGVIEHPLRRT
jgi:hypothetical protein